MKQHYVVSDFDNTLYHTSGFRPEDIRSFQELEGKAIRVIATGRSLFSCQKTFDKNLSFDYLVFASGAGVYDWKKRQLLKRKTLSLEETKRIFKVLREADLDFAVQNPVPSNHLYTYFVSGRENPDFQRRLDRSKGLATAGKNESEIQEATQFVVIEPPDRGLATLEFVKKELPEFSIVRATSPLDKKSFWIEIFTKGIDKGAAVEWLSQELKGISRAHAFGIGDDHNDLSFLNWVGMPYTVPHGIEELKNKYPICAGFAEAIVDWEAKL